MVRLIDADALLDFLDVGHLRPPTEICFSELMMKNIVDLQPTVEAVPVVRCSDCIWWAKEADSLQGRCALLEIHPTGAWFCANGKAEMDEVEQ